MTMRRGTPSFRRALAVLACGLAWLLAAAPAWALDNGLARTPPMGWNDWNAFGCNTSAALVEQTAQAMVSNGMKAAGYRYVNIDDCWLTHQRDANGNLVADPVKFPQGIKAVADHVHSLGLKLGIYEDAGTATCAGYPGSLGHERQDAATFASWGVDYLKYDNCNNAGSTTTQQYIDRYAAMRDALAATGRPIVFSICEWGVNQPWTWAPQVGNLWRTTGDISDGYGSMLDIFHQNVKLAQFAGPGGWNDPDMLEIGNGGMSDTEYRSEFSLWAEMAAPLIAGTDLRTMSAATRAIYTNAGVIAVDQDPLGVQGTEISSDGTHDVLSKPLANGDRAVVLFNEGATSATFGASAAQAGLPRASSYLLHDLWSGATTESAGELAATVPAHGVVMWRVSPGTAGAAPPQTTLQLTATPDSLAPGQSTKLTETLTDYGRLAVSNVKLSLTPPSGWALTPTSPSSFGAVHPGGSVSATWTATAPPATKPIDTVQFGAAANYVWGDSSTPASVQAQQSVHEISPVQPPYRTFASTGAEFGQLGNQLAIYGDGTDVWTGNDEYGSIYLPGGAGSTSTAVVEVTAQQATDPWAKAGIMFRNVLTKAGSSTGYVILAATPGNGYALQWDADESGFLESNINTGTTTYPSWLKLVRNGTTFTGYYSTDGRTWQLVGTATLASAAATQDVGVFSTSHAAGAEGEADFAGFGVG
jgi:alpha-galactosidase